MTRPAAPPRREVLAARGALARRAAGAVAVVAAGAAIPLVAARVTAGPPAPPPVAVDLRPVPLVVPVAATKVAAPAVAAPVRRPGCALPVGEIGVDQQAPPDSPVPADLLGVAASATGCTIATWSVRDVRVSRDDGAAFATVLAGFGAIDGVAVAPDQTVVVVRGGALGTRRADGTEAWHELPRGDFDAVAAGDRWVVVLGPGHLAATADGGATWRVQALPPMAEAFAHVDDDGTIRVAGDDGPTAPVVEYAGRAAGGPWSLRWRSRDGARPDALAFDARGALVVESDDDRGHHVVVVGPSGAVRAPARPPDGRALRGAVLVHPRGRRRSLLPGRLAEAMARDAHGFELDVMAGRVFRELPAPTASLDGLPTTHRWLLGDAVPSPAAL